ncbi:hypothetical protein FACS1894217_05070 [Clostridia bacterium]|nr:hypothetical protein FACS1894217_05070 [Clostridia bacterium]
MAKLIKCDGCGKTFPEQTNTKDVVQVNVSGKSEEFRNYSADICNDCYEDLHECFKTIRKNQGLGA